MASATGSINYGLAQSEVQSENAGSQDNLTGLAKEKKKLFGLLKKKGKSKDGLSPETTPSASATNMAAPSATTPVKTIPQSASPGAQPQSTPPTNPMQFPVSPLSTASPSRYVRSASPGLHSPAASSIFERNVQEAPIPDELAKEIPYHIQTEDYIPPTLEASSQVITDEKLNPDQVEIVTHSLHLPAASTIANPDGLLGSGTLSPISLDQSVSLGSSAVPDSSSVLPDEQPASHYGSLDATDVRRLSFISFADVVQAEHALEGSSSKDLQALLANASNRSPSPIRSLDAAGPSPPTSGAPSMKGIDIGPKAQQPLVATFSGSPQSLGMQSSSSGVMGGGELQVETMRQALRKTGSGDLSQARSPISPVRERVGSVSEAK